MSSSIVFCREIHWDDVIRTNTHSMAGEFVKQDWRCGWIARSMTPWRMFYSAFQKTRELWARGGKQYQGVWEYASLYLLTYGTAPILRSKLVWKNAPYLTLPSIKGILKRKNFIPADICWVGSLSMGALATHIGARRVIYQAHDAFSLYPNAPKNIREIESEMIRRSDIVLSTSEATNRLLQDLYPNYAERFHVLTHGVHMEKYQTQEEEPVDLQKIPGPRAVLVGTLDIEDEELLVYAAQAFPELSFVLIGPGGSRIAQKAKNSQIQNIHILGPRLQNELPRYLNFCDIGLIAYPIGLRDSRFYGTNPMKRYEYAAAGLPTVSTCLREYELTPSPIFAANNPEEYVLCLREALKCGASHRADLLTFARANTWAAKYKQLMDILNS